MDKYLLLERLCKAMNTECTDGNLVATALMLEESNHNLSNDDDDRASFVNAVRDMLININ